MVNVSHVKVNMDYTQVANILIALEKDMIPKNKKIGVVVSGGLDSSVLWHLIYGECLRRNQECIPFTVPKQDGALTYATRMLEYSCEYYGTKSAKKNILLGFAGFLLMTILMLFTLAFKPLNEISAGINYDWALPIHGDLKSIFMPFPIFFGASMIAYLSSQFFDVWFFDRISKFTSKKFLLLRNNFSTIISSLIDNTIFSIFAWIIFKPDPLDFKTVLFTFILGTYILRIFIALFDTPFMYLAKYFLPNNHNE